MMLDEKGLRNWLTDTTARISPRRRLLNTT
jgi:hypothetical protein